MGIHKFLQRKDTDMDKIVKIGIIGCGPRALQMGRIVCLLSKCVKLTAMSEPDQERLNRAGGIFPGIELFLSSDELLEKGDIDAIIVETPPAVHAEYVIKALNRGLHVMSEIPIADSMEEGEVLWKAVNGAKSLFMTGATANYRQKTRFLVDMYRKGLIGTTTYAEAEYMHDLRKGEKESPWRKTYETCRYCCHSLGPLLEVMEGDEITSVSCMGTGDHLNCGWSHNVMAALYRTRKGVVIRCLCGFAINHCGPAHRTVLYTDKGHFKFYNERALIYDAEWEKFSEEKKFTEIDFGRFPERFINDVEFPFDKFMACGGGGHGGSDFLMIEDFAGAIINGKESPVSVKKGLAMTLPGLFAAESAHRGGELVQITYPWN